MKTEAFRQNFMHQNFILLTFITWMNLLVVKGMHSKVISVKGENISDCVIFRGPKDRTGTQSPMKKTAK
jgi:hypothetical protein